MSDHKNDLMVIIAGYEDDLNASFFKANKGMESRFIWRFKIDNYTSKELLKIFQKLVGDSDWILSEELCEKWFEERKVQFKNYGRDMEILFSYVKIAHARRIYGKSKDYRKKITADDMNKGYITFLQHKKNPENKTNKLLESLYV